jgi:hypothetical protein
MHAIVSLLDKKHYQVVEDRWAELKREFSVEGVYVTPYGGAEKCVYVLSQCLCITQVDRTNLRR